MMYQEKHFAAILLMAGEGSRFAHPLPKQFHLLGHTPLYLYTLKTLRKAAFFDTIVLVCHPTWIDQVRKDVSLYPEVEVVEGGNSRQASSYKGLLHLAPSTEYVMIHDALRPFIDVPLLQKHAEAVIKNKAVNTCVQAVDTLVYAPNTTEVSSIPKRADYLLGQTPQTFAYDILLQAHEKAHEEGLTSQSDDCSLILRLPHPVSVVEGNEENIKVTHPLDLSIAHLIHQQRTQREGPLENPQDLQGKLFAITGGSGGIGSAITKALEGFGARVVSISPSSPHYQADLTSWEEAKEIFTQLHKDLGPLDGLVNCMGLFKVAPYQTLPVEEIRKSVEVNFLGPLYAIKAAVLKPHGHILNITSSAAAQGRKGYVVYAAAKAALVNFTQGLSQEEPHLYINALSPGRTDTKMRTENFPNEPKGVLLKPEEIAKQAIQILQGKKSGEVYTGKKRKNETCWTRTNDPLLKREML